MPGGTGVFQAGNQLPGFLLDLLDYQKREQLAASKNIAVASTAVVYGQSFYLRRGMSYGWEFKFSNSAGAIAVTVELEQANQPPTTELAQDDAFVIPIDRKGVAGLLPIGSVVDNTTYIVAYQPDATVLARLRLTGTGSNDASTVLNVARFYQIKNT